MNFFDTPIIKLAFLALLIIIFLGISPYIARGEEEGFVNPSVEGFQDTGGVATDAQNPTISEAAFFGVVPQAASISIYKKTEARAATANPDGLEPNDKGSVMIDLMEIPEQPADPDDIQVVLEKEYEKEPFTNYIEEFQTDAQKAAAAVAAAAAANAAVRNPGAALYGQATGGLSGQLTGATQAGVQSLIGSTIKDKGAAAGVGVAAEAIRAEAQARAEEKAKERVMAAVRKQSRGKIAQKAKRIAIKGAKKVATKVSKKLGSKLGTSFFKKIIVIIAKKLSVFIAKKAAAAGALATTLSSSIIAAPLGILLAIIAAVGISIQIAMSVKLQGEEGVCLPGFTRLRDKIPGIVQTIINYFPGMDVLGALMPYMCYDYRCDEGLEDGGAVFPFCYPPCEGGYKGLGPMCWAENRNIGVGVLKTCPSGWNNDGLICREPIRTNGSIWPWKWSGGRLLGRMNDDPRLVCPSSHPDLIAALCYKECPMLGGQPYSFDRPWPIYVRPRSNKNEIAAQIKLDEAKKKYEQPANPDEAKKGMEIIEKLTEDIGKAIALDKKSEADALLPYIRNPKGPRIPTEFEIKDGDPIPPGARSLLGGVFAGMLAIRKINPDTKQVEIFRKYVVDEPEWEPMPSQSKDWPKEPAKELLPLYAAGKDGNIYVFMNNQWTDFNKYIGQWSNVPLVKRIAVSCRGMPVVIDRADKIWRYRENKWSEFSVGAFGIDIAGHTLNCAKDDTQGVTGEMIVGRDVDGNVYVRHNQQWPQWNKNSNNLPEGKDNIVVLKVAISPLDDRRYMLTTYRKNSPLWLRSSISNAGVKGGPPNTDPPAVIFRMVNGVGWTKDFELPPKEGTEWDMAITPDDTVVVSTNENIYLARGTLPIANRSTPIKAGAKPAGGSIKNISVDRDGILFVQAVDGNIYQSTKPITKDTKTIEYTKLPNPPGGGAVDIGASMITATNPEYSRWINYSKFTEFTKKYPYPDKSTLEIDIPTFFEKVTIDPRVRLKHLAGMPYQCVGHRGLGYGRGVGVPKLTLKMVDREPEPPPPPPTTSSAYYADDQQTKCRIDYSDTKTLQDICQFYYRSARISATENADKSLSFGFISKITKVVASSEQSCDVLCDITSVIINPVTGKTVSSNVTADNDRRFYFAKILKACKFIVTASTNINGTAPDVKDATNEPKSLTFVPNIDKCDSIPLTVKQCTNKESIDKMMKMYTDTQPPTIRVKQIDGAEVTGTDTCTLQWQEATYDAATNKESAPIKKVGRFIHTQDKANEACAFTLQKYAAAPATTMVTALPQPIVNAPPLPKETTLRGCPTKCSDPMLLNKLVNAFNTKPGSVNRILSVKKAFTGSDLRCDIEAEVFVKATKKVELQAIRFDLAKDGASCVFNVTSVGDGGSGTFIQSNTPELGASVKTQDFVMGGNAETVKAAQTKLSGVLGQMTGYVGKANTSFEKTFADVGQLQTLGTCAKKCSDQDILELIVDWYNRTNYPKTRTNVTKKTITRILKAGTASKTECDVTFEEKQETYVDLYNDAPKVNVTQRTQRFVLKETDPCTFMVDAAEGFQNPGGVATGGLPMKPRTRPSVVNNASPLLAPPFSSAGCELDCTKKEVLDAMKQKYDSNNIEGFSPRPKNSKKMGFFEYIGSLFSPTSEGFQDEDAGVTDWTGEEEVAAEGEAAATEATGDWVWNEELGDWEWKEGAVADVAPAPAAEKVAPAATATVTPSSSQTLKRVNRALKVSADKCEYEVVFDKTEVDKSGTLRERKDETGYFTATFTKDPKGCMFTPLQVSATKTPIIPNLAAGRVQSISYSF